MAKPKLIKFKGIQHDFFLNALRIESVDVSRADPSLSKIKTFNATVFYTQESVEKAGRRVNKILEEHPDE